MIQITLSNMVFVSFMCFFAGFVDSIAGGGGLISLPSYYAIGLPGNYALGNNKFSSTFGTLISTINYSRKGAIVWKIGAVASIMALIGSSIGSNIALMIEDDLFSYIMLVLLPLLTFLSFKGKKEKPGSDIEFEADSGKMIVASLFGFLIGMYDGFFGPGTGMFLTLAFSFLSMPLIKASGTTKVVNLSSNLAALTVFIINGNIIYKVAIPTALFSIIGNFLGSRFALKRKSKAIKPMLLFVIILLYMKIVLDLFSKK